MDPLSQSPHPLVPCSQTVCYLPWLKVSVALRYVRTFVGSRGMARVRRHIRWLVAEQNRLRKAGSFH